jgi:hypothetical protein
MADLLEISFPADGRKLWQEWGSVEGLSRFPPGKDGLGAFAPLLDRAGNSVKGQKVTSSCQNG